MLDDTFHDHHGLRPAEAPVGGTGGDVGPAQVAAHPEVGDLVSVVDRHQSLLHHLCQRVVGNHKVMLIKGRIQDF